jgi:Fic family protein
LTPGGRKERQSFRYEAFVPDPIARLEFALPAQIAATVSAAELQVDLLNRDPPAMASLEVLARRLLRAESVASSRIEGLVLSQRRLAKAEAEGLEKRDETARSVVSNVAAMEEAVKLGAKDRPLKTRDIVALHRILMKATSTPGVAGKLRDRQNWIGGNAFNPGRSASGAPSSPSRSSSRRQRQWSWQIALSPFRIHGVTRWPATGARPFTSPEDRSLSRGRRN